MKFRAALALAIVGLMPVSGLGKTFKVEESTIAEMQRAIQTGEATCKSVVQAYLDRVKAYNGVCTALVTEDGKPIAESRGPVRAGAALIFPTRTIAASSFLPDLDQYHGLNLEFGRMEPTRSDPTVQAQFGMRVGIREAGQLNALETLNLRGERSVACKAECDASPSQGALPASCPKTCDAFRKQPDALERAEELDRLYGRHPDLKKMPMYCVVFSWKNWYDAKDMRSTGGNDVDFAMDAPPRDSPDVAALRAKGAISFAIANAQASVNETGRGPEKPTKVFLGSSLAFSIWGGQPCNPYDTERVPRGSSSGSGVSIAANLAMCSLCEQSGASCKGPASRNGIVSLLAAKGVMMDGGVGHDGIGDRAGIECKTMEDAVRVLDAAKGSDTHDIFRTVMPEALVPKEPYASFLLKDIKDKPLKGMRIAIVREFMVKHTKNDEAISDLIDQEIKTVLRDRLGAELVQSSDPKYPADPSVPKMKYTFQDAFKEILPRTLPEYFWQKTSSGELEFAVPGWDVTSIGYAVALAEGRAPLSERLSLRRISKGLAQPADNASWERYLHARGDERITDLASWVRNAKFGSDKQRADALNALNVQDERENPSGPSYLKMHVMLRMVVQKVMRENGIDAFVNPEQTTAPPKLGYASEPQADYRDGGGCCQGFTALMGAPEIEVPAGFTDIACDPNYVLNGDKTNYVTVTGTTCSKLTHPMPISLMLWAGPGSEADLIKIASAYEATTHHRRPPPDFGPVKSEVP